MNRNRLAILYLSVLAGCASSEPRLFTLGLVRGPVRSTARQVIVVDAMGIPGYLRRDGIVHLAGPGRLAASEADWWAEPLPAMARRAFVADLAQRLPDAEVVGDDAPIRERPDLQVQVDLERFEADADGRVTLSGHFAVVLSGSPARLDRLSVSAEVAGENDADRVAAMSDALGRAADVLALAIVRHAGPSKGGIDARR